jgi:hypothetical protein
MNEEDIKTILEEPIPKGPAKKNKRKQKKHQVKKKEESRPKTPEPEELIKNVEQQGQGQEQQEQEQQSMDEISIPMSLSFIVFIRNLLNNITPRTKWRPEELAPVGMAINELTNIIRMTTQVDDDGEEGEEGTNDEEVN